MDGPRRRNRKVTTCLECRTLKRKCSRTQPCVNCQKTGRECVFPAGPAPLTQNLGTNSASGTPGGVTPAGRSGGASSVASSSVPAASASPASGHSLAANSRHAPDMCLRIGKLSITDRIGGLRRGGFIGEVESLLRGVGFGGSDDPVDHFSAPIAVWFKPHSQLPFGQLFSVSPHLDAIAHSNQISVSEAQQRELYDRYFLSVYPVCSLVSRQDLQREGHAALALRMAVSYAAATSLPLLESQRIFGLSKSTLVRRLQAATESAISRAGVITSLDLAAFQTLLTYLTPQLLSEVSRTHSVFVAAVLRHFQVAGFDRAGPGDTAGERDTKRHLWHHLLFLNTRCTEAVGPERTLVDDPQAELPMLSDGSNGQDIVAVVRYECYRIHRMVFRERPNVREGKVSFQDCLQSVMRQSDEIRRMYLDPLDDDVAIQRYARLVGTLLLSRSESMLLHGLPIKLQDWAVSTENRNLRERTIRTNLSILEAGLVLETDPELAPWAWYSGAYHQYHAILFPLSQVCIYPDLELGDRIMAVADHVFGPSSPESTRQQRAVTIVRAIKDNLASFLAMMGDAPPRRLPPHSDMAAGQIRPPLAAQVLGAAQQQQQQQQQQQREEEGLVTNNPDEDESQREGTALDTSASLPGSATARATLTASPGQRSGFIQATPPGGLMAGAAAVPAMALPDSDLLDRFISGFPDDENVHVWWAWPPQQFLPDAGHSGVGGGIGGHDGVERGGGEQQPWFR